jgi:hypothetical protein
MLVVLVCALQHASLRTRPRRRSCSFKNHTLLMEHSDAVSALLVIGDKLVSGSWDTTIKVQHNTPCMHHTECVTHTQHLVTVEAQHRHRRYMLLEYILMHDSVLALCLMLCACCWCYRCGTQRVGYVSVR